MIPAAVNTLLELLEDRRLLAGVTILAPTWDSGLGGYVLATENNMAARLGGFQNIAEYTVAIAPNADGTLAVQGVSHDSRTSTIGNCPDQQVVLVVDYTSVSQKPEYPLRDVAGLVASFMENTPVDGVRLAELPVHEIGVSRSSVLMDEISRSLGLAGIWVDQETYNDPHPIGGDPRNVVYDNVAFVDNYWRTSGQPEYSIFYNGTAVDGAYNLELPFVQADAAGFGSPHQAPASYYDATIDLNSTNEIIGPEHDDWWGTTPDQPPRDQTGFYYSSIVGGPRPLSGVWPASGGTADRQPTGQIGQQWPNVTDVSPTNGTSFASGAPVNIRFLHGDRDDNSTVTFYLDTDQNPYSGNFAATLGSESFGSSESPASATFGGSTRGVPKGTYYLAAQITDGEGHQRVVYSEQQITITKSAGSVTSSSPPLTSRGAAAPVTLVTGAQAASSVVSGTSTSLSALGGGSVGESNLTYTWSVLSAPTTGTAPVFSDNDSNGAKSTSVTFSTDGSYQFRCTITDGLGDSVTSDTSLTVNQTATILHLTPTAKHVHRGKSLTLHTVEYDQFSHRMRTLPARKPIFTITHGKGEIGKNSGLFVASKKKTGVIRISVTVDGLTAVDSVTVVA